MALALRFAEEAEFSSRACATSSFNAPDVAPSKAFFRWSRPVREQLGSHAHSPISIQTLIVALPGAAPFIQQLTSTWTQVGTLVTNDQAIPPCKLQADLSSSTVIKSKMGNNVAEKRNTLVVLLPQDIPVVATWVWLNKLREHVDAEDVVCLDSQLSTIYADQFADETGPKLRMLSSSTVTDEMKMETPVRPLEVPQFVAGVPAALLTHGELRKRRVRVFVSLRDVATTPVDVMRSFLPLVASPSSVLGALERPMFFQPTRDSSNDGQGSLNVLYT
ncbi:putative membrane protein [Phytophthora megakarya]|uniref:Putative membrane protein n=1 Tax=Phytophthora megakarya TaxID=4795 RepID=A0A225WU02_9STRA|nr:putative membrane protein [Phytophthora megakarya]